MKRNCGYGLAFFSLGLVSKLAFHKGYWNVYRRLMIGLKYNKEDGEKLRIKMGSYLKIFSGHQEVVSRG